MPKGIYKRGIIHRNPHSEETKRKIGEANSGKKRSEEVKQKIRLAKIGSKYPNRKRPPKVIRSIRYKICLFCKKKFIPSHGNYSKAKFCSNSCSSKSRPSGRLGKTNSQHQKDMIKLKCSGKNHFRWIEDRSKLAKQEERNGNRHKCWSRDVKQRDGWKCKIDNCDCNGKLEAHHILSWRDYPELRYKINNGITLCQAHHPRKRVEEQRLIPTFQKLVNKT